MILSFLAYKEEIVIVILNYCLRVLTINFNKIEIICLVLLLLEDYQN